MPTEECYTYHDIGPWLRAEESRLRVKGCNQWQAERIARRNARRKGIR